LGYVQLFLVFLAKTAHVLIILVLHLVRAVINIFNTPTRWVLDNIITIHILVIAAKLGERDSGMFKRNRGWVNRTDFTTELLGDLDNNGEGVA
jgi:hypothetical protein